MTEVPKLIQDLGIILGTAGAVSILCKWLKQPLVLGYILAGFLVGPHFKIFPTIQDASNIQIWAEMGVIFLLFGLGLEFSFKRLAHVGPSSTVIALVEVVSMIGLGFLTGQALGWSRMDSIFLGAVLSISSTTIIFRAIDELGLRGRKFVNLVFGVLIVEDLVAVLILVILSTLAVSRQFHGEELIFETAKLGFFLVLWFLAGIFILPSLFNKSRRFLNEETTLIVAIGLCLLMVLIASRVGFSPALGAFMMGSLLAETHKGEKIVHLIRPVRNLFAAIFFVSVGMLLNPQTLVDQAKPVLVITLVTLLGKFLTTFIGSLISGQSLRHSAQTGMSLSQIGEFSFIIASLGLSLKVTSDFIYPVAVAVSAVTTLTTPYMIRSADNVAVGLEKILPQAWLKLLDQYNRHMSGTSRSESWRKIIKSRFIQILANSILVIAIFGLSEFIYENYVIGEFKTSPLTIGVYTLVSLACAGPFLWAVAFGGTKAATIQEALKEARTLGPLFLIEVIRVFWGLLLVMLFLARTPIFYFGETPLLVIAVLIPFVFWFRFKAIYRWFELRFLNNFNVKNRESIDAEGTLLAPWDAHIVNFKVPAEADYIGKSFVELKIREEFGVSIAVIKRGQKRIAAPGRDERLFPFDEIGVIGTDDQLNRFRLFIESSHNTYTDSENKEYVLKSFIIGPNSPFLNKMVRDSGVREKFQGLVVGIERKGERILNPDSTLVFQEGDLVWVVGEQSRFKQFSEILRPL